MAVLELSTVIGCPLKCSYCPQDRIGKAYDGPRLMSMDVFSRALFNCPPKILVSVAGMAEPYLNRLTSSMIVAACAAGSSVQVYTTGIGMTDADVSILLAHVRKGLQRFVLHLPDGDGDMQAKVTPEYARRMAVLLTTLERKIDCRTVCFGNVHPMLKDLEKYRRHDRIQSRAGNAKSEFVQISTPKHKKGPLKCGPGPDLKNNVLLPNGDLVICCQDYGLRHVIGNLLEQTWDEIHASKRMSDFKELMDDSTPEQCLCRTCEYAEVLP